MTIILMVAAVLATTSLFASDTSTLVKSRTKVTSSSNVTLGTWHLGFSACKAYAIANKVPLIAVWSNGEDCTHCKTFENAVNSSTFRNWMKTSGCVFYFTYPGDGSEGKKYGTAFNWIRQNNTNFPFVRIYWPAGKVDVATYGDVVDGGVKGTSGGKKARDYLKKKLAKYTPPKPKPPAYSGGSFNVVDTEESRLEAEIGKTTSVDVNLTRTNTVVETASTNTVVVIYPDGTEATNRVEWTSGTSSTNLSVDIKSSMTTPGQQVSLILLDAGNKAIATNHITMVDEPANSPKNPRWIGERDEDTLAWGEWTMDIDVATNKVAAYNKANGASLTSAQLTAASPVAPAKAYTLLLIGGPLWCPDCVRAEEYLINTDAFRAWATNENRIACVAIDEPCFAYGYDGPTLLSEKTVFGASGAGYLSRKMADPALAAEIAARNLAYVNNDTNHGGFCTPDNLEDDAGNTGKWRTGIPCIIVLREDGSVAGRLFQFSNSTAAMTNGTASAAAMVQRLREIVAQDGDATEELNDNRHTTTETLDLQAMIDDRTLSFSDVADVYRLDAEKTFNQRVRVTLAPVAGKDDFLPGTRLGAKIVAEAGSAVRTLAATNAPLDGEGGVACAAEITSSNCFVVVDYPTDANVYALDPQFALGNEKSTLCHYQLKIDFVAVPREEVSEMAVVGGLLPIALVSNTVYRLTGIDAAANANMLEPVEGTEDRFVAKVTGDVNLVSAANVKFQIWNPGTVGFVRTSASVSEPQDGEPKLVTISLARTGGVSGRAAVKVALNAERSSKLDDLVELGPEIGETLIWEEGDDSEKTVTLLVLDNVFADGDQTLLFDLIPMEGCDAVPGVAEFRLALLDNDKKTPGRLALVASEPAAATRGTVFQRAGGMVRVGVGREDGTTGTVSGTLTASEGELDATEFVWKDRESDTQFAELTLGDGLVGKKVKVALTPARGGAVDSSRRTLTVNVLAADVPGFAAATLDLAGLCNLPLAEGRVALDDAATDGAVIRRYSGALAPGLAWSQEGTELVITGVPTKAGVYTAVFRAYNGAVAGLTVTVTVVVTDPVVAGGGVTGKLPLNPSIAVTRTFTDMPVWDVAAKRLQGLLTLTLPRTGRASAKYRTLGTTWTLSCANWSGIADGAGELAAGTLTATLADRTGACTLDVAAAPDGTVMAMLTDPDCPDAVCDFPTAVVDAAADFKGYYTVSLPQKAVRTGVVFATGAGYATLKMNTAAAIQKGLVTYAGLYPDGKPFSGTARLALKAWNAELGFHEYALVPLFVPGTTDALAGAVRVSPGAADPKAADTDEEGKTCLGRCSYQTIRRSVRPSVEAPLVWTHGEKAVAACAEVELDVFGGYYVGTENFASCCQAVLGATKLKFFALEGLNAIDDEAMEALGLYLVKGASDWTAAKSVAGVNVTYAKATSKAKTKTNQIVSANTKTLALSFTAGTGLVTGSFKMPFDGTSVTLTFQGVVQPGWGSQDCASCGMGGSEATLRPFISGTAWFNDTLEYEDANGRARTATVRRSCPFSVGVKAGE